MATYRMPDDADSAITDNAVRRIIYVTDADGDVIEKDDTAEDANSREAKVG